VIRIPGKALGRDYDYVVTLPFGYADNPGRRYPVLMYTDVPQSLELIAGMHRRLRAGGRGLEDAILVGLAMRWATRARREIESLCRSSL